MLDSSRAYTSLVLHAGSTIMTTAVAFWKSGACVNTKLTGIFSGDRGQPMQHKLILRAMKN